MRCCSRRLLLATVLGVVLLQGAKYLSQPDTGLGSPPRPDVGAWKGSPGGDCSCKMVTYDNSSAEFHEALNQIHPQTGETVGKFMEIHHPNLPLRLLHQPSKCSRFPDLHRIHWNARVWQVLEVRPGLRLFLFAAYFDHRPQSEPSPCVRILALANGIIDEGLHCEFWFSSNSTSISTKLSRIEYVDWQETSTDQLKPFVLTCPTAPFDDSKRPAAVSLTAAPCSNLTNVLKVINSDVDDEDDKLKRFDSETKTWNVGVCGTALYFHGEDLSLRLVDWIETLKALGAARVFLYVLEVHPNMEKVLDHYSKEDFLTFVSFTYPEPYLDLPEFRRYWVSRSRKEIFALENIYFTDCVLRNMASFRFLLRADIDEVPIISKGWNLPRLATYLLRRYRKAPAPSYALYLTLFHEDLRPGPKATSLPRHAFILRHSCRFKDIGRHLNPGFHKCIYDTDQATGISSHSVLLCAPGSCRGRDKMVPEKIAIMAHYRRSCDNCTRLELTEETRLLVHKDRIVLGIERTLETLRLTSEENASNGERNSIKCTT